MKMGKQSRKKRHPQRLNVLNGAKRLNGLNDLNQHTGTIGVFWNVWNWLWSYVNAANLTFELLNLEP